MKDYAVAVERAEKDLRSAKAVLKESLTFDLDGNDDHEVSFETLARMTNKVAEAEGRLRACRDIARFQEKEMEGVHLALALARIANRNSDDAWSGRGNDARRAFNDGMQEVLLDAIYDAQEDAKYEVSK